MRRKQAWRRACGLARHGGGLPAATSFLNSAIQTARAHLAGRDCATRGPRGSKRRKQSLAAGPLQAPSTPAHHLVADRELRAAPRRTHAAMAGNKLSPSKRTRDGALVGGQRRLSDIRVSEAVRGRRSLAAHRLPLAACRGLAPAAPPPCRVTAGLSTTPAMCPSLPSRSRAMPS